MNSDIRLAVGFWQHPKTKKTARRLGLEGIRSLQILWLWAAQNRANGNLSGMDWEDIELAADWQGEERTFFDHCLGMWIDETPEGYVLHDWAEHNPWQAGAGARKEQARANALSGWEKRRAAKQAHERGNADGNADSMQPQCENDAAAMPSHDSGNAPFLTSLGININTLTSFECLPPLDGGDAPQPVEKNVPEAPEPPEAKAPSCPYEEIRALYHEILPEHPRVEIVNEKRRRSMKARWADIGRRLKAKRQRDGPEERLAYLRRFFGRASESDFLTGKRAFRDGSVYIADFDKLMSPGGFAGVIEGKYDNRERW